jgi:hypothetical protein
MKNAIPINGTSARAHQRMGRATNRADERSRCAECLNTRETRAEGKRAAAQESLVECVFTRSVPYCQHAERRARVFDTGSPRAESGANALRTLADLAIGISVKVIHHAKAHHP